MTIDDSNYKVVVIGARGYVGNELLQLLAANQYVNVVAVSSRSASGQRIIDHIDDYPDKELCFTEIAPVDIKSIKADVFFLALPNQVSVEYVNAIKKTNTKAIIIDISADYRFDKEWAYGLPELNRHKIAESQQIANPGCYATAAMLSLLPVKNYLMDVPTVFGVSGYSGAGKTPSDKNDPQRLKDNFLPYKLSEHMHENEVSYQLGKNINFMPHVAPHFRGLSVTLSANLNKIITKQALQQLYAEYYSEQPLISISSSIPELCNVTNKMGAMIGGFVVDSRHQNSLSKGTCNIRLVTVLDNLLKGAASQAMHNMNIALGLPEYTAIRLTT